ncbi:MAG: hypothetical protein SVM80_09915 [Halobacteriota archaeon]|nr:hypothetical protein [Halobacteriota archaeon]
MEEVLSYNRFIPNDIEHILDAAEAEKLYKGVRQSLPDCVALHGSRVYGNPRGSSDLDVIEIYDEGLVAYEHLMSEGIEVSILKTPREKIEQDIGSDVCGNYLTTRLCKINKPLEGEKDLLELEMLAMDKLLREGLKKMKEPNETLLTTSYGMKLITTMRMWYEPQRWWSIYSSFIDCPKKDRNIAIYYNKTQNVMNNCEFLTPDGTFNGERIFTVDGVERVPSKIEDRIRSMYHFAKAQFSASDLRHIFGEMYPKMYGVNMALIYRIFRYPELFTF